MTFGSNSVAIHLLRGCIGFGALAVAILAPLSPFVSATLIPVALIALKGCPACWTMGLIETVALRHKRRGPQDSKVSAGIR